MKVVTRCAQLWERDQIDVSSTIDRLGIDHIATAPTLDAAAVHAKHGPFVWATLQRLGVRDAYLDDLYQEVFIVVHKRLSSFDTSAPMPPWLFGICVRVAAAHRRRAHHRREQVTDAVHTAEVRSDRRTPEDDASHEQSRQQLQAILDEMDLARRAIFVMFEIDELSCDEIAATLGIPVGTVYSRLHHARKEFGRAVERWRARSASGGSR